jgi:electron transfer flavoprotein alpha/beta subunit
MRILASFKVTPDYEALRPADWAAAEAKGRPRTRFVRRILNCFDESALELALRLSEGFAALDTEATLGAVTVGDKEAEPQLKTLLALGYERAERIDAGGETDFAPAAVAALVARYTRDVAGSDLLLLGCRSGPGDSGTVPFLIAEALGWPCLTQIVEMDALSGGRLHVTCAADDGLLRVTLRPPCVLAVGNAVVSRLRVPTLSDRLSRRDAPVGVLSADDLGVDVEGHLARPDCVLAGLEVIDRSRAGVVVDGATPREKARLLFEAHLEGRIGSR